MTCGPIPARAGIGLRSVHHSRIEAERPALPFIEVHTENYFHAGGAAVRLLGRLREHYALSLHGVGLALGSWDALDSEHLRRVREAVRRFEPALVSEHACWGRVDGEHFNDLLPLPFTDEAVRHLAARVSEAQDALGRQLLIENVSQYLRFAHSTLGEGEFLAALVAESGCALLLDLNNLYVNAVNVGADALATIEALPPRSVAQYHLAGHLRRERGEEPALLIDDHGSRVHEQVWSLFERALERIGPRPALVEWDTNVPSLEMLLAEAALADERLQRRDARAA